MLIVSRERFLLLNNDFVDLQILKSTNETDYRASDEIYDSMSFDFHNMLTDQVTLKTLD